MKYILLFADILAYNLRKVNGVFNYLASLRVIISKFL